MTTYRIIRFYRDNPQLNREVITEGLTLEQAQDHCKNPQTSSTTATHPAATARTELYGPWFDGYEEEEEET